MNTPLHCVGFLTHVLIAGDDDRRVGQPHIVNLQLKWSNIRMFNLQPQYVYRGTYTCRSMPTLHLSHLTQGRVVDLRICHQGLHNIPQVPAMQTVPPEHVFPHAPQFLAIIRCQDHHAVCVGMHNGVRRHMLWE
jgi:hypothetical protein